MSDYRERLIEKVADILQEATGLSPATIASWAAKRGAQMRGTNAAAPILHKLESAAEKHMSGAAMKMQAAGNVGLTGAAGRAANKGALGGHIPNSNPLLAGAREEVRHWKKNPVVNAAKPGTPNVVPPKPGQNPFVAPAGNQPNKKWSFGKKLAVGGAVGTGVLGGAYMMGARSGAQQQ